MRSRILLVLAFVCLYGCASTGGPRHVATVSVVTSHGTLMLIDATEEKLVCDTAGAPQAPMCVPPATHKAISAKLAQAFDLDADVARTVKAMPVGTPTTPQVLELLSKISVLVSDVMALIPQSSARESLAVQIGGK